MDPLVSFLWILFVIWSLIVGIIWFANIGGAELRQWFGGVQNTGGEDHVRLPDLFAALQFLLSVADSIWIVLGAANVYIALTLREGLAATRSWALTSLASIWIVSALSVWSDWPMGAVYYTERLGVKLGPVPLGWLLLLFCLFFGARDLAFGMLRTPSHTTVSVVAGAIVAAASLPLSLAAWKARAWLIWYPGTVPAPAIPPLGSYITLFVLGFATAWMCRQKQVAGTVATMGKPAAVFLIFVAYLSGLIGVSLR